MVNIKDDVFEFDDLDELWALVKNMRAYAQVVVCRRGQMAQGVMDAIGRDCTVCGIHHQRRPAHRPRPEKRPEAVFHLQERSASALAVRVIDMLPASLK